MHENSAAKAVPSLYRCFEDHQPMNYPVISVCMRRCASAGKPGTYLQAPQAIDRVVCDCAVGGDADAIVPALVAAGGFALFTGRLRCLKSFGYRRVVKCVARKQNFAVQTHAHRVCANLQAKRCTAPTVGRNSAELSAAARSPVIFGGWCCANVAKRSTDLMKKKNVRQPLT